MNLGSSADFELGNDFTIGVWVNTSQSTDKATLLAKNKSGSSFSYMLLLDYGQPTLTLGDGVSNPGPFALATSIADGTWHHIAFTMADGTLTGYVDGTPTTTWSNLTGSANANSGSDLWVGWRNDKTDRQFEGTLDELKLYSPAITDAEVADLANLTQNSEDCPVASAELPVASPIAEATPLSTFPWTAQVYPNPSQGPFQVRFSHPVEETVYVTLIDLQGKVVLREEAQVEGSPLALHPEGLRTGLYMLRLESASSRQVIQVMIE